MLAGIAPCRGKRCTCCRVAFDARCARKEQRGEAGRDEIHEIIEARRGETEMKMPLRLVADHGIGGVHGLIGHEPRQAEQQIPEERGNNAIGGILGEAFKCGAGHTAFIQGFGVATDNLRDGGTARSQR